LIMVGNAKFVCNWMLMEDSRRAWRRYTETFCPCFAHK